MNYIQRAACIGGVVLALSSVPAEAPIRGQIAPNLKQEELYKAKPHQELQRSTRPLYESIRYC